MIITYINGSDRSSDITQGSLTINNQIQQRSDNCSFEVFQNAAPVENQDLKIYDGDLVASISSNVITVQGLYARNVNKFYAGQVLWLRLGNANAEKVTVQSYTETTLQVTLVTAPVITVSNGDQLGELIFGGVVSRVKDKNLQTLQNLLYDVTGVDYSKIFDKKIISSSWANVDSRYIINDFCNTAVNYGATIDQLSYATNGAVVAAWTKSGDANNPTTDTADFVDGSASGVFSWTYSTGTAMWATTISSQDFSAFTGVSSGLPTKGMEMIWAKFADLTKIGRFKLQLGSNSSNYATLTLAPTVNTDWGYQSAKLVNVTLTGTPVWTAVTYAAIVITETASSSVKLNSFRILDSSSFTNYHVQPTTLITDFRSPQLKPTALMNQLAQSFDFTWYIDYERDVHFIPKESLVSPYQITDVTNNFSNLSIEADVTNLGNRIIINGGSTLSTSTYAQVFQGDGVLRAWILQSPFDLLTIKIDDNTSTKTTVSGTTTTNIKIVAHGFSTGDHIVNRSRSNAVRSITKVDADNFTVQAVTGQTSGDTISYFNITKTAGIDGLTDETTVDYLYNSDAQSVRASAQTLVIPAATYIRFSFSEKIPIQLQYMDAASVNALKALGLGDGIFDLAPYSDANIQDLNTAFLTAQAKVGQFSNAVINGTFNTDQRGLRSGQLLTINQTIKRGINETYVIQKVNIKSHNTMIDDYFQYTVTFGTTLFGWIELMQKILRNNSNITANTNQVVETFVTSDDTVSAVDTNAVAVNGGFQSVKNTEAPTVHDTNTVTISSLPWEWEVSSGQPLQTRWNLFEWQ